MQLYWWQWVLVWCLGSVPFGLFVGHLIAAGRGQGPFHDYDEVEDLAPTRHPAKDRSVSLQEG